MSFYKTHGRDFNYRLWKLTVWQVGEVIDVEEEARLVDIAIGAYENTKKKREYVWAKKLLEALEKKVYDALYPPDYTKSERKQLLRRYHPDNLETGDIEKFQEINNGRRVS